MGLPIISSMSFRKPERACLLVLQKPVLSKQQEDRKSRFSAQNLALMAAELGRRDVSLERNDDGNSNETFLIRPNQSILNCFNAGNRQG